MAGSLDNLRHDAAIALLIGTRPLSGAPHADAASSADGADGPWDGAEPADQDPAEAAEDPDAASYDPWGFPADDQAGLDGAGDEEDGSTGGGAQAPGSVPLASIHLTASLGTMFALSQAPAELAGFGLIDAADTRALIRDASGNPGTRFCVTLTGADGTAVAHACARGPRPWAPPGTGPPATAPPTSAQKAAAMRDFIRSLGLKFTTIAREPGDRMRAEPQHDPSRALSHLIRARNATCATPGCGAAAVTADLDHVIAYEIGGPTSEDNLDPRCRHDHRLKQHPRWTVEVIKPGATRWTGPSGRSRTVHPTRYLL